MSAELVTVDIGSLDPNPFRQLKKYPYIEAKIETLIRSVKDVGVWERIIVRRYGNRFQKAFGHHLEEACRRAGIKKIPVIVRELNDEQMVQFMGRENLEDYNANFLVMLETWEAGEKFLVYSTKEKTIQPIEIARLLGWTRLQNQSTAILNSTASACYGASQLVKGNHIALADLDGLSVRSVREIVERTMSRIDLAERVGKAAKKPAREIERDVRDVTRAAKYVAQGVRAGSLAPKNIRAEIDFGAVKNAAEKNRESPLLAQFAKSVSDQIHKLLVEDSLAPKLAEIEKVVPMITRDDDRQGLKRIDSALEAHGETTDRWRDRLTPRGKKVVPMKLLKKEK